MKLSWKNHGNCFTKLSGHPALFVHAFVRLPCKDLSGGPSPSRMVHRCCETPPLSSIPSSAREKVRMSEAIDNPEAYTKLTDHVYHMILMSMEKDLRPATELLKRIESRDLYKCIGQGKPKKIFKLDMVSFY